MFTGGKEMNVTYAKPVLKILNTSNCLKRTVFQISGLSRGKAYTLGNSLRRNLLHYIPGVAPVAMRMVGVGAGQEFKPVKGLVDDSNALAMKVKNLKVAAYSKDTGTLPPQFILEINKTYTNEEIKFGDFKLKAGQDNVECEVLNKDEVLTYAGAENVQVYMEILFQRGVGYSSYNVNNKGDSIDPEFNAECIYLDSLYSPVVSANFSVDEPPTAEEVTPTVNHGIFDMLPGMMPAAIKINKFGDLSVKDVEGELAEVLSRIKIAACSADGHAVPSQVVLELKGKYKGVVKFGDFQLADNYKDIQAVIFNPDVEIVDTVGEEEDINIKLLFSRATSYEGIDIRVQLNDLSSEFREGAVYIDSLYTPVVDLDVKIIKQAPTKSTETLEIMVETDGSILPADAIYKALIFEISDCNMMQELFKPLLTDYQTATAAIQMNLGKVKSDAEYNRPNAVSDLSEIEVLNLPTALYDALKDNGMNTIQDMKKNWQAINNRDKISKYLEEAGIEVEDCPEPLYK